MKSSRQRVWFGCVVAGAFLLGACTAREPAQVQQPAAAPKTAPSQLTIQTGTHVGIEYTVMLPNGSAVISNVGKEPLVYRQGTDKLPPALQAALHGLRVGDRKRVTLLPTQAYGAVNPAAFQEVDIQHVPASVRKVGKVLISEDATGKKRRVRIHEVRDTTVVLDFNHPLAGKTLHFDVRVVDIQQGEQS